MKELKECLFHGNKMLYSRLVFADKDGVDWSNDTGSPDGLPYKLTTVGREYFAPGDVFVSTLDSEVQRVYKKAEFDPFFKEVEEVESAESIQEGIAGDGADDHRGDVGGDVHRPRNPRDGDGGVRVADDENEVVGAAENGRGRRAAQRRVGRSKHDASKSKSKSQRLVKAKSRNSSRKPRG